MVDAYDLLARYLKQAKADLRAAKDELTRLHSETARRQQRDLIWLRTGKVLAVGELYDLLAEMEACDEEELPDE